VKRRPPRWKRRVRGTHFRRTTRRRRERSERATHEPSADPFPLEDRYNPVPAQQPGVLARVMGWLFGRKKKLSLAERGDPPPGEDPVRRILALSRGPARLDAFEETLTELEPGTPGHTGVALAFHRELTTMAERADVDLSLLKSRTEACAEALIAAGEAERAGQLLSRIGKKHRAAELFVAAGAIDELEAAHAAISAEEGGRRLDARLAYERFEGRFLVGMRRDALAALDEAITAWPDHPVYREIRESFDRRLLKDHMRLLWEGGGERGTVLVRASFPIGIGRAEDAALAIKSPLVSREHLEIARDQGALYVRSLQSRSPVELDGAPLEDARALGAAGTMDLSGVEITYEQAGGALQLCASPAPDVLSVTLTGDAAVIPVGPSSLRIGFDDEGRALVFPHEGVRMSDGPLESEMMLLAGDSLLCGQVHVRVPQDR
jgi:hypothetical protein